MNLVEHLKIGTPLVWVQSFEPDRVLDIAIQHSRRDLYRIDPFDGFVKLINGEWKKVLVQLEGEWTTTHDFPVAIQWVYENKGCFFVNDSHLIAEKLLAFLNGLSSKYRSTFWQNDFDLLPMQLILTSYNTEMPPEIARFTALEDVPLPTPEELRHIATYIVSEHEENVLEETDMTHLVRAGMGLSEAEFVEICVLTLRDKGRLDHEDVNAFKRAKLQSGGTLEVRRPIISFDDIGGLDKAKELIKGAAWAWDNPEEAHKLGVVPLRKLLMIGVPGTGKSAICEATAKTLNLELAKTGISQNMSKWVGQSEANMRFTLAQIRALAPIVCWIDELGRDLSGSGQSNDSGTTDRVHGEFLTGLQELPENVFLMGAANYIDGLPPEMLRADRFDKIMFVGFPSTEERFDIFKIHLGEEFEKFNVEELANMSAGWTGAEIKAVIKEARSVVGYTQHRSIETEDVLEVMGGYRNRIILRHPEVVKGMYRKALDEFEWASSAQLSDAPAVLDGSFGAGRKKVQSMGSTVVRSF